MSEKTEDTKVNSTASPSDAVGSVMVRATWLCERRGLGLKPSLVGSFESGL